MAPSPAPTPFASRPAAATSPRAKPAEPIFGDGWQQRLLASIERQVVLCATLEEATKRQADWIEGDRVEVLLAALVQRQGVIDELARLHADLEPYRVAGDGLWLRLEAWDRARVDSAWTRVREVVTRVLESDEQDRRRLQDGRDRLGRQLSDLATGRATNRAYATTGSAPAGAVGRDTRFLDAKA